MRRLVIRAAHTLVDAPDIPERQASSRHEYAKPECVPLRTRVLCACVHKYVRSPSLNRSRNLDKYG